MKHIEREMLYAILVLHTYNYTYICTATSSNLATCQYTQYHIPVHIQVVLSTALELGFRDIENHMARGGKVGENVHHAFSLAIPQLHTV